MFLSKKTGIHFPWQQNALSSSAPVQSLPLPEKLVIPLLQHRGIPSQPLVKSGDEVLAGQKIGQAAPGLSLNVHAPLSGMVQKVTEISLAQGGKSLAVVLIPRQEASPVYPEVKRMSSDVLLLPEVIRRVKEAGVCGMGGAGFPVFAKLEAALSVHTLIVNATQCEPYITCDEKICQEFAPELISGMEILKQVLGLEKIFVGMEPRNHGENPLRQEGQRRKFKFEIQILGETYPQGDEKLLIRSCTGQILPPGELPSQRGILVMNAHSLKAFFDAVVLEKPLTERVVTLSGPGMKNPGNYRIPLGTTLEDAIQLSGGLREGVKQVLVGGPMMGFSQPDLQAPVTKTTLGILALTETVPLLPESSLACIRCSRCIDACPFGIQPQLLYFWIRKGNLRRAERFFLSACKECGCCDVVCPARIPLVDFFKRAKAALKAEGDLRG